MQAKLIGGLKVKNLKDSADMVVQVCLGVKPKERFLIVSDIFTRPIGEALFDAAISVGAETMLFIMKPRSRHGEEPPEAVAEAMSHVDVFVAPTKFSLSHTQARKRATETGIRGATMPGITEEIFIKTMTADYNQIKNFNKHLKELLMGRNSIRVMTDSGTDLIFSIQGRKIITDDGIIQDRGAFGNLPAGEVFVSPVEGTANGKIVVDASIAGIGLIGKPVQVIVKEGFAIAIEGSDEAEKLRGMLNSVNLKEAFNIAEFGFGTNPKAEVIGNVLEDEKAFGTVHIALGDNSTIGGMIRAGIHIDMVLNKPTVLIDGELVMEHGVWLINSHKSH